MAEKKEKKKEGGITLTSDSVDDYFNKKFGEGIFVSGQSIIDTPKMVIPFSPALDLALGGGVLEGSFCVLTGPPKVGKTTSCLDFAGTAQQKQYNYDGKPRHVYFFNVEGRIKSRDLAGIRHLIPDKSRMTVIKSRPGKILSAEDYLEMLEAYIHTKPGAIFIIDSFSQLCSESRMTTSIASRFRDDVPLMIASLTKRVCNVLPINNNIVLGVTHLYANQDPASKKKWAEASGRKIQYEADVKLRATYCTAVMDGESQIGQKIHWECGSSGIGGPGGKVEGFLRYGYGLDKAWELVNYAKDIGLIQKNGAWYTLPDENKFQGLDKTATALRNNPKMFEALNKKFREAMAL